MGGRFHQQSWLALYHEIGNVVFFTRSIDFSYNYSTLKKMQVYTKVLRELTPLRKLRLLLQTRMWRIETI